VAEQRYQAVLAVISDGETVTEVAARFGVARQTVHDGLARSGTVLPPMMPRASSPRD
jgi:transposase-like protein